MAWPAESEPVGIVIRDRPIVATPSKVWAYLWEDGRTGGRQGGGAGGRGGSTDRVLPDS